MQSSQRRRQSPPTARRSTGQFRPAAPAAVLLLLLSVAAVLVVRLNTVEVAIAIDGRQRTVNTRAGTVADLLLESGVNVEPGDLVIPAPGSRIGDGDTVVVQRARPVQVRADGESVKLRSHGRSAQAVLHEAGVQMGPNDRVKVNGQLWPADFAPATPGDHRAYPDEIQIPIARLASAGPAGAAMPGEAVSQDPASDEAQLLPGDAQSWQLDVIRAVPVTIVEDGIPFDLELAGDTVIEALQQAGITVYAEDRLHPGPGSPVTGGMQIRLRRATPFTAEVDGVTTTLRAWADTVGDGLDRAGIDLKGRDYSVPPIEVALSAGIHIQVIRVVEDILVREVSIPFGTITEPEPNLALDVKEVLRPGEAGLKRQRIRIMYENGEEISRELEEEEVLREPVTELLAYGTNVVWRTIDTPVGPKRYWRQMRVYATSYSLSRSGTPKSAPWYGRTWLGIPMRHGIVAVDPRYVPLSTNLFVPGYGIGFSGDKGGGIKGRHIDLGFDDDNYESWHWSVDLYLLEPLPGEVDMVWMVPD